MVFAEGTTVSVENSQGEIRVLVKKYGADQFVSGEWPDRAMIGFRCNGRMVRFTLMLPNVKDPRFTPKRARWNQTSAERHQALYDAEQRRLWRALCLTIKAKLESVASGISTFDSEFMPFILMPDGRTVAEHVLPAIDAAYKTGKMQPLLLGMGDLP